MSLFAILLAIAALVAGAVAGLAVMAFIIIGGIRDAIGRGLGW